MTPQAISDFHTEPPRRDVPTSLAGRGNNSVAIRETRHEGCRNGRCDRIAIRFAQCLCELRTPEPLGHLHLMLTALSDYRNALIRVSSMVPGEVAIVVQLIGQLHQKDVAFGR